MKENTVPGLLHELAKSVWNAQRRPSARKVARALNQAGHPIHYTTINRWRSQGWGGAKGEHPIDAARANLDSAVPVLTRDPTTTAEDILNRSETKPQFEKRSDKELLTAAARQALVTLALVEQELSAHVAELVTSKPRETAVLIKALADMSKAATGALREVHTLGTG